MPDIGGFGRGLLKGALSATEKAAEKVKDAAEAASRRMNDDDPDATQVVKTGDLDTTRVAEDADPEITQVIPGSPRPTGHNVATPPAGARPGPAPGPQNGGPAAHNIADAPAGSRPGQAPGAPQNRGPAAQNFAAAPAGSRPAQAPGDPRNGGSAAPAGDVGAPAAGPGPSTSGPSAGPVPLSAGPAAPVADTAPEGEPSLADEPEDHADASEVRELVEMFQQLLAKRRPPAGPIPGEWSIGVGDLLAEHPKVPKRVRGLVVKLNRFGGVAYSPQEVEFDGDDVPWEKVTELRTHHVVDYLVGDAVQQQVENLPMPWFPGRKRLLDALGQALLTITIATAKNQLEKFELGLRVPAEVVYKASFGRSKELNAGVVSALVLADPAVNQSLIATAQARGIAVTTAGDEMLANADERADKIREKVKALEAELERFSKRFGRLG